MRGDHRCCGFSAPDAKASGRQWTSISAAPSPLQVLGDATKSLHALTAAQRLPALQSGESMALAHHHLTSGDVQLGIEFRRSIGTTYEFHCHKALNKSG